MIGFMNFCSMPNNEKIKYDITAETDGYLAIIPFGEIKNLCRKAPKIVS
jgi:hypothetical protein